MKNAIIRWFGTILLSLTCSISLRIAIAYEGAGYARDSIIPIENDSSYGALASRILPNNAELIRDPVSIDFGADRQGVLLIFSTYEPVRQYHIWYLAKQQTQPVYHKIIVKDPEPMDEFFDLQVKEIFTVGPEGAKDLVLLEEFSRPAIAGGEVHPGGSVYRRSHLDAQYLEQASQALDGVTSKPQALEKLEPWIAEIPPTKAGSLIDDFLNLPVAYINATKLERWALIKPDSPRVLVRDMRNGYVQIAGDGGLPGYTFAHFKTVDGDSVFALQTVFPVGQQTLFLKRAGNHWTDISQSILPDYKTDRNYVLPHVGTDLIVYGPDNRVETIYQWNRERFVSKNSAAH